MKSHIHPDYHPVVFKDASTGHQFLTRSTATSDRSVEWEDGNEYPLIVVDVTSESHPFWTGAQRVMDTAGRVEKFQRRYGNRTRRAKGAAGQTEPRSTFLTRGHTSWQFPSGAFPAPTPIPVVRSGRPTTSPSRRPRSTAVPSSSPVAW